MLLLHVIATRVYSDPGTTRTLPGLLPTARVANET